VIRRAVALAVLAVASTVPSAHASPTQESIFMDDPEIVFSAPDRLEATLTEIKALGADRIRVSVFWHLLAPAPNHQTRPFPAGAGADPRSYAAAKWDRFDAIVTTAERVGLEVLFNVTTPAPYWATPKPPREDLEHTFRPRAAEFGDFVTALGTRYSGTFRDEAIAEDPNPLLGPCEATPNFPVPPPLCPDDPGPDNPNPPNTGPVLPRVDAWSIWNEPNMPGWLTPQSHEDDLSLPASPHIYRRLLDRGYEGLARTGHGSDTILIAETAPRGERERSVTQSIKPLLFVRELYCLDAQFRHFTGRAAERRNCPDGGRGFQNAHPVLFNATGFAHHPYALERPPAANDPARDNAPLSNIGRLLRTLDRAVSRHGSPKRFKVWFTEYGYQTDPPDPYVGWPWKLQARFLSHAELLAYRRSRVRSTAQFLLYDDSPLRDYPESSPRYWGTFQTGLRTANGKRKPAYRAYSRGIHVDRSARRGERLLVFAYYRPATAPLEATVQFRPTGEKRWQTVGSKLTDAHGHVIMHPEARRSGEYRARFSAPGGTARTLATPVRVRRG